MLRRHALAGPGRDRLLDLGLATAVFTVDCLLWGGQRSLRYGGDLPWPVVPALTAAAAATMLLRRRQPTTVYAVWWLYGLLPLALPGHEPLAGLLVSLYTVAARRRLSTSLTAAVASAVPLGLNAYDTVRLSGPGSAAAYLTAAAIWYLLAAVAWGVGRLGFLAHRRAVRREEEHAAEVTASLRDERMRLARELHDIVAHSVTAMILQAAGARTVSNVERGDRLVTDALTSIERTGIQAMRELHRLLGLLRAVDPQAEGPDSVASLSALDNLLAASRDAGIQVEVVHRGPVERDLDPSVDAAAYRFVQEGLANVIKHGGRGSRAALSFAWDPDSLTVRLASEGGAPAGPAVPSGGFGLIGLRERISALGGTFTAGPAGPTSFVAVATLPRHSLEGSRTGVAS